MAACDSSTFSTLQHCPHYTKKLAVIHQLEFALAICVTNMNLFAPVVVSGLDRIGIKSLYQPGFTEPSFSYTRGMPAVFTNTYLAKINDILHQPHVWAFIGMGIQGKPTCHMTCLASSTSVLVNFGLMGLGSLL